MTRAKVREAVEETAIDGKLYLNFRATKKWIAIVPRSAEKLTESHREKRSLMTARVTVDDVHRVAELANLELESGETAHMVQDLNAILDYIAELNELDTAGVAPLAQVSELEGAGGAASLRSDALVPSLSRSNVMPQAPDGDQAFFKVPKVIERA